MAPELMSRAPLWEMPLKEGYWNSETPRTREIRQRFFFKSDLDSAQKKKPATVVHEPSNFITVENIIFNGNMCNCHAKHQYFTRLRNAFVYTRRN